MNNFVELLGERAYDLIEVYQGPMPLLRDSDDEFDPTDLGPSPEDDTDGILADAFRTRDRSRSPPPSAYGTTIHTYILVHGAFNMARSPPRSALAQQYMQRICSCVLSW